MASGPKKIERHGRRFRVTWFAEGEQFRRTFDSEAQAKTFLERLDTQRDLDEQEPMRVKGTRRDYEGRIRREVGRNSHLDANALARNPRELRAFNTTLGPTSARRLHAILRQAFQDAFVHGEVSRNPCDLARPRKPRAAERLIPSPTEVERMIHAATEEDSIWGLFVNVTATLGTRRAETSALRWEDVDFRGHRVHVRRALCKGADAPVEVKLPKTGHERALAVGEEFFAHIREHRRPTGWIFTGGRNVEAGTAPWHPDWPGHRFQQLMQLLEMPYTLHSLRHFVATQLLTRGLPVNQVAQFMGHKDPSVTMNLYANHVVDDVQRMMGEAAATLFRRRPMLSVVGGGR